MRVTTGKNVKKSLKERNFFLNLTKLTTQLKSAVLLKMNLEDEALDDKLKETIGKEPLRRGLPERDLGNLFNDYHGNSIASDCPSIL